MLEELKQKVLAANLELVAKKIVIYTWGNVSGIDRERGLVVIKPSGVDYDSLRAEDLPVLELETGKIIEGNLKPSSDTPTHLEIYRHFANIGGIAHTHSVNAVAFAQAGMSIPALGTTHADYFHGGVPCTRGLTRKEIEYAYELNTGKVIAEYISEKNYDPLENPGIIVKNHGPFTWGESPEKSVFNAVVLETVAEMALKTLALNPASKLDDFVLEKHYSRKHGPNAYYGQ